MCPNCIKGLVAGELCLQCSGTGFWNPESRTVEEVRVFEVQMAEAEQAELLAKETSMDDHEQVATSPADNDAGAEVTSPEMTVTTPDAAISEPTETTPVAEMSDVVETSPDAGVQAPAPEANDEEVA